MPRIDAKSKEKHRAFGALRDKHERSKDCLPLKRKIKGELLIKVILLKNQIVIPGKHRSSKEQKENIAPRNERTVKI